MFMAPIRMNPAACMADLARVKNKNTKYEWVAERKLK